MSTKTTKLAQELLDRFFREAEGQTDRKIDAYFISEAEGIGWDRAEPALEFLKTRGLIEMVDDSAFLTALGIDMAASEKDISDLPMHQKTFAGKAVGAVPVIPANPAPVAAPRAPSAKGPPPVSVPQATARPSGHSAPPAPEVVVPKPRARPKQPRLVFTDGDGENKIEYLKWSLVLGRADEADLTLKDARASKRHCEVRYESGHYVLEDLGSANGTVVNGNYITQVNLQHGDLLLVGRTELFYECPENIPQPAGEPSGAGVADTIPPPPSSTPASVPAKPKVIIPPMGAPADPILPPLKTSAPPAKASVPSAAPSPSPVKVVRGRPESAHPTPAGALFLEQEPTAQADPPDLFGARVEAMDAPTASESAAAITDRGYEEEDRPEGRSRSIDDDGEATMLAPTPFDEPEDRTAPPKQASRLEIPRLEREAPDLRDAEARTVEFPPPGAGAPNKAGPAGNLPSWSDALGGEDTNPPFYSGDEEVTPAPDPSGSFVGDAPGPVLDAAAELPEAPDSPDDFSGDISGDIETSGAAEPAWHRFETLLSALETEAEAALIPEKASVLEAIRTLKTHPFVRSAVVRIKQD